MNTPVERFNTRIHQHHGKSWMKVKIEQILSVSADRSHFEIIVVSIESAGNAGVNENVNREKKSRKTENRSKMIQKSDKRRIKI